MSEVAEVQIPHVLENLTEEECYLHAILSDESGLDIAEFTWYSPDHEDGCFRAWPYQWSWWRCNDPLQVDQSARSVGKSLSIKVRAFAFPFLHPGNEMVITAPELVHLEPIVSLVEQQMYATRLSRELLVQGRSGVTHRPFQLNLVNGSRIIGRIPQRDGKGIKGCLVSDQLVLSSKGFVPASNIEVGDQVLTHSRKWQEVLAVEYDENDCYEVRGAGSFPMVVSCDHRFLGAENVATPKQKRDLLPLAWHDVEFLTEHQVYWATPTAFPTLPVPPMEFAGTARFLDMNVDSFWFIVGRYLADGHLSMNKSNGKERRVHFAVPSWKQFEMFEAADELDRTLGLVHRDHSSADMLSLSSAPLYRWLLQHFGQHANGKTIPPFALGMRESHRRALLEGYLAGDGSEDRGRNRRSLGTSSKALAIGIQLLAQSLGYTVNCSVIQPNVTEICGRKLKNAPQLSWHLQIGHGHSVEMDGHLVGKVKSVTPVGKRKVVNIITADHTYLSGSIMSHNIHPLWLEQDEASDYPEQGWMELIETLKRGHEGAVWRAHGVTRGIRDKFYEITQDTPDNDWTVHRYAAMWRPNWTDQERSEKIKQYGSRDDPDYRRNILGLHGDATNPMFVLTRLMSATDDDPHSEYNESEFFSVKVKAETISLMGQTVEGAMDFPPRHSEYRPKATYWSGMDVGFTVDPSEILTFVEYRERGREQSTLKLLSRVNMQRIGTTDQMNAILHTIDFYRPRVFAMDKTGLGLPLYQLIQEEAERRPEIRYVLDIIKGYNFSEKVVVGFDDSIAVDEFRDDPQRTEAQIRRTVLEYASDTLRTLVDEKRILLPWEAELLKQFQGSTWQAVRGGQDQYGRRLYSKGNDHILDAARMAVLGWKQYAIEELLKTPKDDEPVFDAFV